MLLRTPSNTEEWKIQREEARAETKQPRCDGFAAWLRMGDGSRIHDSSRRLRVVLLVTLSRVSRARHDRPARTHVRREYFIREFVGEEEVRRGVSVRNGGGGKFTRRCSQAENDDGRSLSARKFRHRLRLLFVGIHTAARQIATFATFGVNGRFRE